MSNPINLRYLLQKALEEDNIDARVMEERIKMALPELFGIITAENIDRLFLSDKNLCFVIKHPAWKQELMLKSDELLLKLTQHFGNTYFDRLKFI